MTQAKESEEARAPEVIRKHESNTLKWISLATLVIQNASTILLLRYLRTLPGDMFFSTTAIVCQEFIKMTFSVLFLYCESFSVRDTIKIINTQIVHNFFDCIKTGIPAFLYTIQNNLIYVGVSNLDAAVFQVTFQLKILTTAMFMVTLLNRKLLSTQWVSLLLLFIGVAVIQVQNVKSSGDMGKGNAVAGLTAVLVACVLSGMAGVYFEKILKNSNVSIWTRNIQLGMFGSLFAFITAYLNDGKAINEKGFFFGYTNLVWINIFIQSFGGLIVAVVIKYADNILKGFATSLSIVVSCVASVYLFGTHINLVFGMGTLLVISATLLYSYTPPSNSSREIKLENVLILPSAKLLSDN